MIDISGFGTKITIAALATFPQGFGLTQFADDVDPLSAKETESTGYEMLFDGGIFIFDKASVIELSVGVIAGSDDDINLKILLQQRKGGLKILPVRDVTSMVITYPDGGIITLTNGSIIKGPFVDSLDASGRKKGNVYTFVFGSFGGAQSASQLISTIASTFVGLL